MKILHSKDYEYVGIRDLCFVFVCKKKRFDPEILMLKSARVIVEGGKSKFYDERLMEYYLKLNSLKVRHDYTYSGIDSRGDSYKLQISNLM